jgi:hypothetical protein
MKIVDKSIKVDNRPSITYTHYQLGSDKVCFMFSGTGYTYDSPALYYATLLLLEKKYDIIQIHYSSMDELVRLPLEEIPELIIQMVNPVVEEVISNNQYSEYVFMGKSLGTIPIVLEYMQQERFNKSRWILLTPALTLASVTQALLDSKHNGYIAIGDADPNFSLHTIENLKQFQLDIISKANHSLNIDGNIQESIKVIERILNTLDGLL